MTFKKITLFSFEIFLIGIATLVVMVSTARHYHKFKILVSLYKGICKSHGVGWMNILVGIACNQQ